MRRTRKNIQRGKLEGLKEVMSNLHSEIEKIEGYTMKGLIRSVIRIRRTMDKQSPLIPIDKGNLRASWFTVTGHSWHVNMEEAAPIAAVKFRGEDAGALALEHSQVISEMKAQAGDRLIVYYGFSANYAMWVHELMGATYSRPGSGPKFLEASIKSNQGMILKELYNSAKIKKR